MYFASTRPTARSTTAKVEVVCVRGLSVLLRHVGGLAGHVVCVRHYEVLESTSPRANKVALKLN